MWDNQLRQLKELLLEPFARLVGGLLGANAVTLLGLAAGLASACWFALAPGSDDEQVNWPALLLWLLNRCLDGLDGTIARLHGSESDFGGYLDLVCDLVVYAAIPIGLESGGAGAERGRWALTALLGTLYVNVGSLFYLSALCEKARLPPAAGKPMTTIVFPVSLIEGFETVVGYTAFMLLPGLRHQLYIAFAAGCAVNVVQRLVWARRHFSVTD